MGLEAVPDDPSVIVNRVLSLGGDGFGGVEQFVPRDQLHARSPERLAAGALERIDRLPAGVEDPAHVPLVEERVDRLGGLAGIVLEPTLAFILEQQRDGLVRVLLVRADDPGRTALDPPRAVRRLDGLARLVEDAAAIV